MQIPLPPPLSLCWDWEPLALSRLASPRHSTLRVVLPYSLGLFLSSRWNS